MTAITASEAIGNDVAGKVARRGVERRIEQRRRDEQSERKLGLDHDLRCERQERETRAGDGEQRRVGHCQPLGQVGQNDGREQQQQDPFEQEHGTPVI